MTPARVAELEGYIREGKFAEVEPLLAAYVKERPASTWGWYALGYSQFGQQKIGDSIRSLAKSLELDVRNAEAHKILGRDLMIIGRFDAAQTEFEQAIHYKPDSAESYYNLGKLFSVQDNWEPARKAFEGALRIDPSYVEALDALGFALEALGDTDSAVATYERAIALNEQRKGTYALPHVNLSAYYNKTGDPEKALAARARRARARPEVRRRALSAGTRVRAAGKARGCAQGAQRRDRAQPARILVLLRARGRLPSPRPDGREPHSAGGVSKTGARERRAGEEAARVENWR